MLMWNRSKRDRMDAPIDIRFLSQPLWCEQVTTGLFSPPKNGLVSSVLSSIFKQKKIKYCQIFKSVTREVPIADKIHVAAPVTVVDPQPYLSHAMYTNIDIRVPFISCSCCVTMTLKGAVYIFRTRQQFWINCHALAISADLFNE